MALNAGAEPRVFGRGTRNAPCRFEYRLRPGEPATARRQKQENENAPVRLAHRCKSHLRFSSSLTAGDVPRGLKMESRKRPTRCR